MTQITISNTAVEVEYSVAAPSTGPFTVPFPFFEEGDVFATVTTLAGVVSNLVVTTDFIFASKDAPVGQEGSGYTGGTITLNSSIGADGGTTLKIYRSTVIDRTANFPNTGPFSMPLLNDEQNQQTIIMQELAKEITDGDAATLAALDSSKLSIDGTDKMAGNLDLDGNDLLAGGDGHLDSLTLNGVLVSVTAFAGNNITKMYLNVAAMKADSGLSVGELVMTGGYTSANDGGAAVYQIVAASTGTDDGGMFHDLTGISGQAELIHDGTLNVKWFGAVGDDATDDATTIAAAITAAENNDLHLFFPRATYRFTTPLVIGGPDVDFNKSILRYDGAVGSFALTLNSAAGGGSDQTIGSRYRSLTLRQEDWAEYVTYSGSKVYDPPSMGSYENITNITPTILTTTIAVVGARAGGYARATHTALPEGAVLTAAVTADDVVTVWFNNYTSAALDIPSGTLAVDVVNNAYHGLCLGGSLGQIEGFKVIGFTGVSVGFGSGQCQISGVTFSAFAECYYWHADINATPAAGWGIIFQPRNNENSFKGALFPINAYNEVAGSRRACCINQVVMSGITNNIEALSLETVASEEALLITDACGQLTSSKIIYYEWNTSWVQPPVPYVKASRYSFGCDLKIRISGAHGSIQDLGAANDIRGIMNYYVNGNQLSKPTGGADLVFNGDFVNGQNGWSDFSSGSPSVSLPGAGYRSGKRIRIDLTSGRPNLSQAIDLTAKGISLGGFDFETVTACAWIKTNMNGLTVRVNGQGSGFVPMDEEWYLSQVTVRLNDAITDIDLVIIDNLALTQTGYVEISNVSLVFGDRAYAYPQITNPEGSSAWNPGSIADGAVEAFDITVAGAELGDFAIASFSLDVTDLVLNASVTAADTVTAVLANNTGSPVDLGNGTISAKVFKV